MTWVEVRREKTSVAIEFSTEQDAATFGSTQLSDGSGTQKLEDADIISYSTELTYREHLFKFILFVPKSEQSTLVQQRTN
jgi:hypothetical protein